MSIAFSGVGVGSIVLLPWLQTLIERAGWRAACWAWACSCSSLLAPLNLLLRAPARGPGPRARRRHARRGAAASRRAQRRRPGVGRRRLDARARRAHRPLLVDRASATSAASSPGTRCRSTRRSTWSRSASRRRRGLGARPREPGRHPGPDRARPPLGPHRTRVGLDGRQPRLRALLPGACSCCATPRRRAARRDGGRAGRRSATASRR